MDGLKQRIIGALVLVSLAVIFVPMVFDEPHTDRTSSEIRIPEEPPFPEVEVSASEPEPVPDYRLEEKTAEDAEAPSAEAQPSTTAREETADEPEPAPQPQQVDTAATSVPAEVPKPEEIQQSEEIQQPEGSAEFSRSLEGAWVVQLGSFGSADNARRLRDQVREKGYSSHLREVVRGDSTMTRVFSGPFAEKTEAERAKQALDRAFGLDSLVVSGEK